MDEKSTKKHTRSNGLEDDTIPLLTGFDRVATVTRDSNYWFEDGNLILVSQGVAFRIYRGLLAEHSAMFRSMFDIAQALPATEDLFDGCPVVPLDDSPNDLRELFRLIFPLSTDRKFIGRKVDIAFISAILSLDHKYELKGLYEEAMSYLTTYYTTSFDAWIDGRHAAHWQPDPAHAIIAINLARLTNTPSILPTAFYICATLGPDLVHGVPMGHGDGDESTERLSPEDLHLCLSLKARLAVENARAAFLLLGDPDMHVCQASPRQGCGPGGCVEVWRRLLEQAGLAAEVPHTVASERALDGWVANADCVSATAAISAPHVGNARRNVMHVPVPPQRKLCAGCRDDLKARDREVRRQVWRMLPGLLGLTIENWDA